MNTVRLTVAQALVRFLAAQHTERDGAEHRLVEACWGIFGHGNVAGLGQALVESGQGPGAPLPFLQGRNEQGMVHAAVGFARQRNRLGAQAVTTSIGPGATNLATGAALATVNRLPVLLLPGDTFAARHAEPVLQQLELPGAGDVSVNDVLRPVSRYFDRVTRPEALVPAALAAMRVLADPVETGAVTLALPQDVQTEAYDWPQEFFAERVWRVPRPAPEPEVLDAAVAAVRAARRPLLVAGGGVHHAEAEGALAELADATGIPVASTQAGKGALRHDHPCDVGGIGHTGTATADRLAATADLVLGVGTRYTDFTTASGTLFAGDDVRFVNLNLASFDAYKQSALPLVADAETGLQALRTALAGHRVAPGYLSEYRAAKESWEREVDAAHRASGDGALPTQAQLIGALQQVVDDEDVVLNAAGSLPGDLHKLWRAGSPRQYHLEYGYSCMGYEIPAAIGVQLAAPQRRVWALVGDGSYLMLPGELVTAVQLRLPLTVVLVQNHGYASIGGLSEETGAEGFGTAYRYPSPDGTYGGDVLPVDLAANAASLGASVHRVSTAAQLPDALRAAAEEPGPSCVHVETEPRPSAPPAQAWWDVAVAEVSERPAARNARARYESAAVRRLRHL